jgi:hypothetical protein
MKMVRNNRGARGGSDDVFKRTLDNTYDRDERTLHQYQGSLPGRNPDITYQYTCLRLILPYRLGGMRSQSLDTHQFICNYRDQNGVFKCLFAFRCDCRISDREPDHIANRISDFLVRLLLEAVRCPIGIRAIVVCQESVDFWMAAFESRFKSLVDEAARSDKGRLGRSF